MTSDHPRVFISYSHESKEHMDRVLALADRLRGDGVDAQLDQYEASVSNWQQWMEDEIEAAQFVLVVATETYEKRRRGRAEPGRGLGARWEGAIISQTLYDSGLRNETFIPVIFDPADSAQLPFFLKAGGWYDLSTRTGYRDLYRRLTDQPAIRRPKLGKLKQLPPRQRRQDLSSFGRESPSALSGVMAIPERPPHYLPRPEHLEPLKQSLLHDRSEPGLATSGKIGVVGMGGIGKSVLAAAVAQDEDVRRAFPDGVVWVSVGQEPRLLELQKELAETVGSAETVFRFEREGKRLLRKALKGKAMLLILDDVWDISHVAALDVLGSRGRLLITTRDRSILVRLGIEDHRIKALSPKQARSLLADWAGQPLSLLPRLADRIAEECGYLPLALSMIGAMVRLEPTAWQDAFERLKNADLDKILQDFPDYPHPNLLRALEVGVDALDPQDRELYLELAVFLEDASVPQEAVEVLWAAHGLTPIDSRQLLSRLAARSLANLDAKRVSLHDLQGDYIRRQATDLPMLHGRLVDAYSARCDQGWASGPKDGYFFERLLYHLAQAGRSEALRELLSDGRWLLQKLLNTNVQKLIADFDRLPADDRLRLVQKAIRLGCHVLAHDPEQLASQLIGRLLGEDEPTIAALLERVGQHLGRAWLRPLTRSLEAPGGTLLQVFDQHERGVSDVAVLADGRLVSASADRTLRVWDLDTGQDVSVLRGHTGGIWSLAVCSDGRVVSASADHTLRLWDLETGESVRTFEGHTSGVWSVAALPGNRLVSASHDRTLRVWDLEESRSVRTLEGHTARVLAVALLDSGRVVSASADRTLRVWEPDTGACVKILEGHTDWVLDVAVVSEKRVVSASGDRSVRLWDLDDGTNLQTLEGHDDAAWGLAVLDDGRLVSGSADRSIRVWDLGTGQCVRILEGHTDRVLAVAQLAQDLLVSASFDGTVRVWDLLGSAGVGTSEGHNGAVLSIALLGGNRAVSASADHTLKIWDCETGLSLRTLTGHTGAVWSVSPLADGRVISASNDRTLRLWDLETGECVRALEGHTGAVWSVSPLADGRVISASNDRTLRVWDLKTGESVQTLQGHTAGVWGVAAIARDQVISASHDRTLKIWDLTSGQVIGSLEGHTARVLDVATIDDRHVISASADRTLRVWSPKAKRKLKVLEGHTDWIPGVALLSGGCIASVSYDRSLRVWDSKKGKELARFRADAPLHCVAPGHEPLTVLAGDGSGRLHFLRLQQDSTG